MKLDQTFARDIKREANGDGSREAKFSFKAKVQATAKALSTPTVMEGFSGCLKEYGRVPVAICLAETIIERRDRLNQQVCDWADEVMKLYTNAPLHRSFAYIDDNLHPSRIEEYAGAFIRVTRG